MNYKIKPIFLGKAAEDIDLAMFLYRNPIGTTMPMGHGCFAIQGNGETIIVDSGIPSQREIEVMGLPFHIADDSPKFVDALAKAGIDANEIKKVILTHLHWDHSWNLEKLPNAQIYVQRKEIQHAISPYKHEYNSYGMIPSIGGPSWLQGLMRIVPLEGDTDLSPGIRVITTPGHTPGSQSVLVDTEDGLYAIVSDFALCQRNYNECIQDAIFTSCEDWYSSYRKLKALNPHILTTHDIQTYDQKIYG